MDLKKTPMYIQKIATAVCRRDGDFFRRNIAKVLARLSGTTVSPLNPSCTLQLVCSIPSGDSAGSDPQISDHSSLFYSMHVPTYSTTECFADAPGPYAPSWGDVPAGTGQAMRIVHYIWGLGPGGAERQCVYMARGQMERGHHVQVLTNCLSDETENHYTPFLEQAGVPVSLLDLSLGHDFWENLPFEKAERLCRALPPELRQQVQALAYAFAKLKPDVVQCWMDLSNIAGAWGAILAGVPRVIMGFRNVSPPNFPYYEWPTWLLDQYRLVARHPRVFLQANSVAGAVDYAAWLEVPVESVSVIHNGMDFVATPLPTEQDVQQLRAELSLAADTPVLLGAFRLAHEKRPLFFVDLVEKIREKIPNLRVLHAGMGQLEEEVRAELERRGLNDCVLLLGRRTDIPTLMSAADALILCSSREGFPNVLQEAQYFGCPAVACDVGDAGRVLVHGETGFVHGRDDVDSLVASVVNLLTDRALARRMAEAGRQRALKEFSLDSFIEDVEQSYRKLFPGTGELANAAGLAFKAPKRYTIAIQPDEWTPHANPEQVNSFSRHWIDYFEAQGHEVKVVDVWSSDLMAQLRNVHGFMWRWAHLRGHFQVARRILPVIEREWTIPVFPSQKTCWHYDDKVSQEFLFEAHTIPRPTTWIWFERDRAIRWARSEANYPLVLKLSTGASSVNVILVHTADEAVWWIHRLFNQGIFSLEKRNGSLEQINSTISSHATSLFNTGFAPDPGPYFYEYHKGYVLFQKFLPDNAFDTRANIIGNRCFVFRRHNRPNDFRASGSGLLDFDQSAIDQRFIRLAFETARKLGTQSVAIDGMYDGDRVVVGEVSYTYVAWPLHACGGYWRLDGTPESGELTFVEEPMWPGTAQAIDFLQLLDERWS
ncbi:glycosyltransferase [Geomobilimonas luticola]|uniref:Glycosyltransferase n=1 Tax=Geomobilimonas luticola TaxID=1114878 RepID=A0ABS5SFS6_9BACT|nr:glycosyltransferase [Geomobilimonas luticola]MBT0654210.1 glycosyltransferase [Geomobilimonas luticola]